ncbi:MAG: hypothetical protein ABIH92_01695 [Nanoarchaeota archaeon]
MEKRGLSPIIATVLLVSLGLVIAVSVFTWGSNLLLTLSPPVDCDGVSIRAEISDSEGNQYLGVVNLGTVEIRGFVIKSFGDGSLDIVERGDAVVEPGTTERIQLVEEYGAGEFLVVPEIIVETGDGDSMFGECDDIYGYLVEN